MDELEPFDVWKARVDALFPWPDIYEVLEAVETCGDDRAEERLSVLRDLVEAHHSASRSGVFNDE